MSLFSWMGLSFALAALGAALLTPLVIWLAWRLGALARPRPDRWHQRPTALLGGSAIYVASIGAAALMLPHELATHRTDPVVWLAVWAGATLCFVLGWMDDRRGLGPAVKLVGQAVAAGLLLAAGIRVPWAPLPCLAGPLTVLWVIGITNAFNLLDNMDGVVAGVMAIAALSLAALGADRSGMQIAAVCLAGACCGFLLYNFHPARIFMGDCGSLYLGFSISALSLMAGMRHASNGVAGLVMPFTLLAVPIFDTALVIVTRRRAGRSIMQGGRDHTSHRLAALGISERGVALLLYFISVLLGVLALAAVRLPLIAAAALAASEIGVLILIGVALARVPVQRPAKDLSASAATAKSPDKRLARPAQPPHTPALQEPST